jgi:hypothetical protein
LTPWSRDAAGGSKGRPSSLAWKIMEWVEGWRMVHKLPKVNQRYLKSKRAGLWGGPVPARSERRLFFGSLFATSIKIVAATAFDQSWMLTQTYSTLPGYAVAYKVRRLCLPRSMVPVFKAILAYCCS